MPEPTFAQLFDLITRGGALGIVVFALYGGYRKWYVWGYLYDEMVSQWQQRYDQMSTSWETRYDESCASYEQRITHITQERDRYLELALRSTNLAEHLANPNREP